MSIYLSDMLNEVVGSNENQLFSSATDSHAHVDQQRESTVTNQRNDGAVVHNICCTRCGGLICDRYYLVVEEQVWHTDCLQCCICSINLGQQVTCFVKNTLVYCREDYHRQFTKRCTRCRRPLSPKDLVMRARDYIYHMQCFICIICCAPLQPRELFALGENGVLYCQAHYEPLMAAMEGKINETSLPGAEEMIANVLNSKVRTKKRKQFGSPAPSLPADPLVTCGYDPLGLGRPCSASSGLDSEHSSRSKRMRTSFKHHQLRTMKAYFALNHNPDAKDLKQLAQKSGLTKRVLQVWFQNARAKYRRAMSIRPDGTPINGPATPPRNILPNEDSMVSNDLNASSSPLEGADKLFKSEVVDQNDVHNSSRVEKDSGEEYNSDDSCASRTLAEYFQTESGLL